MNRANESNLSFKTASDIYVYGRNVHIYEQMNEYVVNCAAAWQ